MGSGGRARRPRSDGGVGPFDADPNDSWPSGLILEDRPFADELAGEGAGREAADKEELGWWQVREETFYDEEAPPDVAQDQLPEPGEVGIDIPSSWVSKEWLEGRDAWIKKGGGELERYLATSPFENYVLKRGCMKPNGQVSVSPKSRSGWREAGPRKARFVVLSARNQRLNGSARGFDRPGSLSAQNQGLNGAREGLTGQARCQPRIKV